MCWVGKVKNDYNCASCWTWPLSEIKRVSGEDPGNNEVSERERLGVGIKGLWIEHRAPLVSRLYRGQDETLMGPDRRPQPLLHAGKT